MSQDQSQVKRGGNDEWNTPASIIAALGPFDLDPATPVEQAYPTALKRYTLADNGLEQPWGGLVWLNPPYSNIKPWLQKLSTHGCGIALIPASTGCSAWREFVYPKASAIAFHIGRIKFNPPIGQASKFTAGFYSAYIAYGVLARQRLENAIYGGTLRAVMLNT